MDASLIAITSIDWPAVDRFVQFHTGQVPTHALWNSCFKPESPLAPTVAIDLPLSHIHAMLAVKIDEVSCLLPFTSSGVRPHYMGTYSVLTGSMDIWEHALTVILRNVPDLIAEEWGAETCSLACIIWMLFEVKGFRSIFMKYEKHPFTQGIFTI